MVYFNVTDVAWLDIVIGMKTTLRSSGLLLVKKVKVSHSLLAVGAVVVRVPLYLGHS